MFDDIHEMKSELENFERESARGITRRSKSQWVEKGEKKRILSSSWETKLLQ